MSNESSESNGHYEECDHYDRIAVNKLRERSKNEMKIACKKHSLDYEIIRQIVNLEFDLDLYYLVKVNRLMFDHYFHRD